MNCEICGRPAKNIYKIMIEGTVVHVCASCKSHGIPEPEVSFKPKINRITRKTKKVKPQKRQEGLAENEELVEDYNLIIKKEREKRGWSQEKLAKKLMEKESLIRKIENAEIIPEPRIIEKIEKLFNVKLKRKISEVPYKEVERRFFSPTLGDIAIVKKNKK